MCVNELDLLFNSAVAYGNMAGNVFDTFITVLFSSLAFAAAKSLRNIGEPLKKVSWHISSSSLVFSLALLCFYCISFFSFRFYAARAEQALSLLSTEVGHNKELSDLFVSPGKPFSELGNTFGLPSIGFIIGALFGLLIFLWVSNARRPAGGD